MALKKIFIALLIGASINIAAEETSDLFLYIPSEEIMNDYLSMFSYLRAWDRNERVVDDERFAALFTRYVGDNTLQSLLFESFLRCTKNKNIQNAVLKYIGANNINTDFANSLKKLYAAVPIIKMSDGKEVIQYNYNDSEYDENINLFLFSEAKVFDNELGFLLFHNDWDEFVFNNTPDDQEKSFFLMYGGGTNTITIHFVKHLNIEKENIETTINSKHYTEKYKDKWRVEELPLGGVLKRSGADKMFIAQGMGPEPTVKTIETATFNVYLFKETAKTLYEVSYFVNFSPININFSQRNRIFNFVCFQLLFVYLN
jgi:predicted nucleotidyltransferase